MEGKTKMELCSSGDQLQRWVPKAVSLNGDNWPDNTRQGPLALSKK